jgi:hypothetical protein
VHALTASQIATDEAVQEHCDNDQGDNDGGAIALLDEGHDEERHPHASRPSPSMKLVAP